MTSHSLIGLESAMKRLVDMDATASQGSGKSGSMKAYGSSNVIDYGSLFACLFMTFVYMTNQYIIAPTVRIIYQLE